VRAPRLRARASSGSLRRASPRLKDAAPNIAPEAWPAHYAALVLCVRTLFHTCRLVHADLSEYNVLLHAGAPHIIDVSQAVEHDHPHAFDFLRADVRNVEAFFAGAPSVRALGPRRAFEFVVRADAVRDGESEADALARWIEETEEEERDAVDDEVFLQSYIPRTLNDVADPERDAAALGRGAGSELIYQHTIGLVGPKDAPAPAADEAPPAQAPRVRFEGDAPEESADDNSDDGSADGDSAGGDAADGTPFEAAAPRGHRHEDKDAKKVSALALSRPSCPATAG
jgi:RIO kinase 1